MLLFCIFLGLFCWVHGNPLANKFVKIASTNGKNHLAIYIDGPDDQMVAELALQVRAEAQRYHMTVQINPEKHEYHKHTTVMISSTDNWAKTLTQISDTKAMTSFLIVANVTDEENFMNAFSQKIANHSESSYFYLVLDLPSGASWRKVITVKNVFFPVINPLRFDDQQYIIEEYDMQGMTIRSMTLDWEPFLKQGNCDRFGEKCEATGVLRDMIGLMEDYYNFTMEYTMDLDGNWGTTPEELPANVSGKWGGVIGKTMSGERHQISVSTYLANYARKEMFEFVQVLSDRLILALSPRQRNYIFNLALHFIIQCYVVKGCVICTKNLDQNHATFYNMTVESKKLCFIFKGKFCSS